LIAFRTAEDLDCIASEGEFYGRDSTLSSTGSRNSNAWCPLTTNMIGKTLSHLYKGWKRTNSETGKKAVVTPMFTDKQLESTVNDLRGMLEEDESVRTQEALKGEVAKKIQFFSGNWFQRIDYPNYHITSTSNHKWAWIDEGGLNTLGKRLSSREASILRPWPKWLLIKSFLPDVAGKSVVEIGSSNGFFCFRFSELGAVQVTGIEIIKRQYESAVWSAKVLGRDNVSFLHTDFLLDMTIPPHDVVFLSEVHNHMLFPFYGLFKAINLAKETVVFDTCAIDTKDHHLRLDSGWQSNQLIYHSFMLSDGLIMDFLDLIGIPPSRVKHYKTPVDHRHVLYVIDTTDLQRRRAEFSYPVYLRKVIGLEFETDVRGATQVFPSSLALGTYPLQVIPSTAGRSLTVLVANCMNGNTDAFNSRVYLFNPTESAGEVTVRVFTLPLVGGTAQELTATPLSLATLGARSALNVKVAENILMPLEITTPYTDDGGNLTLEFTIQAADVRGTAQLFSSW